MYLDTLPDTAFNRTPIAFFLYHGANVLVTQNLGVRYGVANGTRGIVVGWQFPPNTTFNDFCYHGVQARLPSAPVECVYVHVTNVRLKKRAPNQPPGLPANVICLPRSTVQVNDPVALPANVSNRKSTRLRIKQVPLRQAIVLTTYSIQGTQFSKYIIAETVPKSMYVQMSRGTEGVASFTLRHRLDKAFATAASPSAALVEEMSRLQSLHETTKSRFEQARGAPQEALNDDGDEITSNMGLESDSSQSDDSGDTMSGDEGGAASAAAAQTVAQVETSVGGAGDLSPGALRRPLTDAEQAMVADAWDHNDESVTVVCSLPAGAGGSSVDILGKHFGRMRNAWLFDESGKAYMFLLQERDKEWVPLHGAKPSHFMSSFFFAKVWP